MKDHNFQTIGSVSSDGKLRTHEKERMNQFLSLWANSKVILNISVQPEEPSAQMVGYWFKKIVPDFQTILREKEGQRLTLEQTDLELRKMSWVTHEEITKELSNGFDLVRIKRVDELDNSQLNELINEIKYIASTNYDYFISD